MLAAKLLSGIGGEDKLYVDDVFSAFVYEGSASALELNTGFKPDFGWIKDRGNTAPHRLFDSVRGSNYALYSNDTAAQEMVSDRAPTFNTASVSIPSNNYTNGAGKRLVGWFAKKAPKFFDVVTYTGDDGVQSVAHNLGVVPGMVAIKALGVTGNWFVWHNGITNTELLKLNLTDAKSTSAGMWNSTTPTATHFTVGASAGNSSTTTYVAYLFAHDTSADGIIQCGSFTADGSGNATVDLGWEPQYVLFKNISVSESWFAVDSMRGYSNGGNDPILLPDLSNAEITITNYGYPTATGFVTASMTGTRTYIYLAIRRPNKPPTSGTQVYNAIARTGTGAAATVNGVGFAPDLLISSARNAVAYKGWQDRLRGGNRPLHSDATEAEQSLTQNVLEFNNDGVKLGTNSDGAFTNNSGDTYINHFFKRAPGFFDVVCATASAYAVTVSHSLGVIPELIIGKDRTAAGPWIVWNKDVVATDSTYTLKLNTTGAQANNGYPINSVTASAFYSGIASLSSSNLVFYLFASLPGVSKITSFVGNGTTQNIECGFTTGARFVLVKATSTTGNWNVGDSTRGIVASTDPLLYLNSTAAEVTADDWLDPYAGGFTVNETSNAHANTNGVTYLVLAIA